MVCDKAEKVEGTVEQHCLFRGHTGILKRNINFINEQHTVATGLQ